ncbi:unnamed protein product [Albugo candida]|uniref:Uncharacterized protein n=1 Tax=Albugo candida TaxID=65357 RepID=A0A024GTC2_9STRA|nr:unnamed protein product [Albugo candida]|eukprot:CCI50208.1 unnamed protein product [Albugo candida]
MLLLQSHVYVALLSCFLYMYQAYSDDTFDPCTVWMDRVIVHGAVFCVEGTPCRGAEKGVCPQEQEGLPYGSYCDFVDDSYQCIAYNKSLSVDSFCIGSPYGKRVIEVLNVGFFCANESVCGGNEDGNCPISQPGLQEDSYCDRINEFGSLGCVPNDYQG